MCIFLNKFPSPVQICKRNENYDSKANITIFEKIDFFFMLLLRLRCSSNRDRDIQISIFLLSSSLNLASQESSGITSWKLSISTDDLLEQPWFLVCPTLTLRQKKPQRFAIVYEDTVLQYGLNCIIFQLFITQQSLQQRVDSKLGQTAGCIPNRTQNL